MKVTFIKEPKAESLGIDDHFKVGKTYDLNEASANRWIYRGVAEVAQKETKKEIKKEEKKPFWTKPE